MVNRYIPWYNYPLVNSHNYGEKKHVFMWASTISMAIFNSKLLDITRGHPLVYLWYIYSNSYGTSCFNYITTIGFIFLLGEIPIYHDCNWLWNPHCQNKQKMAGTSPDIRSAPWSSIIALEMEFFLGNWERATARDPVNHWFGDSGEVSWKYPSNWWS